MHRLLFLLFSLSVASLEASRILGIFVHPGESHFIFFEPILKALDDAGHEVHIISHFEVKNASDRLKQIIVTNPGSSRDRVNLNVSMTPFTFSNLLWNPSISVILLENPL